MTIDASIRKEEARTTRKLKNRKHENWKTKKHDRHHNYHWQYHHHYQYHHHHHYHLTHPRIHECESLAADMLRRNLAERQSRSNRHTLTFTNANLWRRTCFGEILQRDSRKATDTFWNGQFIVIMGFIQCFESKQNDIKVFRMILHCFESDQHDIKIFRMKSHRYYNIYCFESDQ